MGQRYTHIHSRCRGWDPWKLRLRRDPVLGIDVDRYTPSDQVPKDRPQKRSFRFFVCDSLLGVRARVQFEGCHFFFWFLVEFKSQNASFATLRWPVQHQQILAILYMEVDQSSNQCVIPWWFCILKYAMFIHCSSQFLYLFMKSPVGPSNWLGLPEAITLAARFAHKWEAQGDFLKPKSTRNQPKQPTQTTNQQPTQTFAKNTPLVYYGWVDGFVDVDVVFSCHHLLGLIFQWHSRLEYWNIWN